MKIFIAISEGREQDTILGAYERRESAVDAIMANVEFALGSIGNADVAHRIFIGLQLDDRSPIFPGGELDVQWRIERHDLNR